MRAKRKTKWRRVSKLKGCISPTHGDSGHTLHKKGNKAEREANEMKIRASR